MTPTYDNNAPLSTNVLALFRFTNWLTREMQDGRVKIVTDKANENEANILQAQADFVEAVFDEYNALIEA